MISKIIPYSGKKGGRIHWKNKQINTSRETNAVCPWNETKYRYALPLKKC
jgi:hypothetical protein